MKWPFRHKRPTTDVRVFRNPKTGTVTLRLQGDLGIPLRWEQPIITLELRLDTAMSDDIAVQLRDQLLALLPLSD